MAKKWKPKEETEFRKDINCHYVGQQSAPQHARNDCNGLNKAIQVALAIDRCFRTEFANTPSESAESVSLIDPLCMKALALVIKRKRVSVQMLLEEYKDWNIDAHYAEMIIEWMEDMRYISKHVRKDGTREIFVKRELLSRYEEKYGPLD